MTEGFTLASTIIAFEVIQNQPITMWHSQE